MSQRRKNQKITRRGGLILLALWLPIAPAVASAQDRPYAHDSPAANAPQQLPAETAAIAGSRVTQLESNSVIAAALCFAVGFGACLLLVQQMLPSLVRAQCAEHVREYLDLVRSESGIRIVVLDRDGRPPLQKPRRASEPVIEQSAESSYELQQHLRVDQPAAPAGPTDTRSVAAPNSMLSQIYEQNLHLRDQLSKQSRSVKQSAVQPSK